MRTFSSSIGATCTFEKNHDIDISYQGAIPFDWYGFGASILVMEKATNKSVPITAFAVIGRLDNFVASSTEIPTQSKFTYDSGTGTTTVLVESSVISVVVERVQLAKAFTACLFIVNWALTIGSVYITLLTLVGTGKMDPAVVLLPITLVLTIPTLRGLYVGSPPFGTYIGEYRVVKSWFWADPVPRYVRILLADGDSCGELHDTLVSGCLEARINWAGHW